MINAKKHRKMTEWERPLQENERYQVTISCKDEHKKDRNGMDLTEAEDIKNRWEEYTEELYKKISL